MSPRLVVQAWWASRALLVLALLVALLHHPRPRLRDALSRWDVQHFVTIARNGYARQQDMAFFPGLPAVLRAGTTLGLSPVLTGTALAITCSALAAWAVYRIGGVAAACFWLVAPMGVFTLVPYSEAPFAAAAFWAWERALSRQWLQAALLASLACAFRVSGVFLVMALAVLALMQSASGRRRLGSLALLGLPALVVLGYMGWLHHLTGDWLAWFHAQGAGWNRGLHWPWDSFHTTWKAAHPSNWPGRRLVAVMFCFDIISVLVGALTTVWSLARREWAEAVWVGTQLLAFATSSWWMSASRAVLLWFPLVVLLGERAQRVPRTDQGRMLRAALVSLGVTVSAATSAFWAWCFFTGNWAT